jgi:hypothetical protein
MLPPYVYDLIAAVQKWEDEHGDTSMCFGHVLSTVPTRELDRAQAIAHYQRERTRMERTLEDEMPVRMRIAAVAVPRAHVMVGGDDAFCPQCGDEGRPLHQLANGLMVCHKCSNKAGG